MPRVGRLTALPTYTTESATGAGRFPDGEPLFTHRTYMQKDKNGGVKILQQGTGPGYLVYHSSDLNTPRVHGDAANPNSKWPAKITSSTFLIHSGNRRTPADGDRADQIFAWGLPNKLGRFPIDGFASRLVDEPTAGLGQELCISPTSGTGALDDVDDRVVSFKSLLRTRGLVLRPLTLNPDPLDGELRVDADSSPVNELKWYDATAFRTVVSKESLRRSFYEGMGASMLIFNEYMGPLGATDNVGIATAGTGAALFGAGAIDKTDHPGVIGLTTGPTAAGRVFVIGNATGGLHLGVGGVTRFGSWIMTGPTLSDAINEFVTRTGICSIVLPNTILFGVCLEYQFDQNGGRWQGITNDVGETSLDTGITVAASTWYFMAFEVNDDGTSVEFFIDGLSVGTLAVEADIPAGPGFNCFYNTHIMKLAGTSARAIYLDADFIYQEFDRTGV